MGKDLPLKTFLIDDKRFADVVNGFCCAGEQRVKPEDLQELDTAEIVSMKQKRKSEMRRDVIRKVALGVNFAIVGVENQEKVDYSLPYRIMAYDANRYGKQVAEIKRNIRVVKKEGKDNPDKKVTLNSGEYMYDFKKDSRLHPVVTLVLYYGREEYDGATDLHGIIDFTDVPEHLKHMVQNYQVNMIDIRRYENFDMLHTDVKTVFELIRDSTDKEKWQRIKKENLRLEKDAFMVVAAYTNMKDAEMVIEKYETEEGEVDMCKAWENRNATIIKDADGIKLVLINDIVFKGKRNIDWGEVKEYLKGYIGDFYEIEESAEKIYIGSYLPEEYTESESRKALKGANAKAKANAATVIPELIQIATNPEYQKNTKEKHNKSARNGWYRYDVRFALPVYENEVLVRYNVFAARLLVNHAENGKKYLYDILAIKKETSKPQQ